MAQRETSPYTGAFARPQTPNFNHVTYVDSSEPKPGAFARASLCWSTSEAVQQGCSTTRSAVP